MLKSAYFLKASLSIRREKQRQVCPNQSSLGTTYCENRSHEGRKKGQIRKSSLNNISLLPFTWNNLCFAKPFPTYFLISPKAAQGIKGGNCWPHSAEDSYGLPVGTWVPRTSILAALTTTTLQCHCCVVLVKRKWSEPYGIHHSHWQDTIWVKTQPREQIKAAQKMSSPE